MSIPLTADEIAMMRALYGRKGVEGGKHVLRALDELEALRAWAEPASSTRPMGRDGRGRRPIRSAKPKR